MRTVKNGVFFGVTVGNSEEDLANLSRFSNILFLVPVIDCNNEKYKYKYP